MDSVLQKERRKGKIMKKIRTNAFVYSLIFYPLLLFILFYVIQNFNSIILAFQKIDGNGKTFAGFDNFRTFITQATSGGSVLNYAFKNSLIIYIVSLVVCMPLYIFFSYILFKKCLFHKGIGFLIMVPEIMSGLVISLIFINFIGSSGPLVKIIKTLNINDGIWFSLLYEEKYALTTVILYNIWLSFATSLIIYPNAMRAINPEILESAKIDGVNNMFQELWHIILPNIFPTLTTFLITGVAAIFMNAGPLMTFYYTDAPEYVYTTGYYFTRQVMVDGNEFSYPIYSAGGLILTLISAPLTFFVKWFLEKFGPSSE